MPRRWKILFVERGSLEGGGQFSLLQLLSLMDRSIFQPYLLLSEKDILPRVPPGVSVRPIPRQPLRWMIGLLRLIRGEGIHLIHVNTGVTRESLIAALAARLLCIPLIWHARVIESGGLMDRVLGRLSTRIVAISKAVKRRFEAVTDPEKVVVIYNGVDTRRFNPSSVDGRAIRRAFSIPEESLVIGTVSQLIPWKGVEYLIRAFHSILKEDPSARLLIAGDEVPSSRGYRERLVSLADSCGIGERVIFTGFREDIPRVMAAMDVFVLPSLREALGRVLIEAMAMERPVVATKTGGVPEVVIDGETGILVPPEDHEALRDAIITIARDRDLARRLGKKGRERVERLFTMEGHTRKIQDLYLEILRDHEDRHRWKGTH